MKYPDADHVILITRNGMGNGELELQHRLIQTYLRLLDENGVLPKAICFYTEGVRLAVKGSPVLAELRKLEAKGVRLVLCSTCLNYYQLSDQVEVGIVGGMADILEAQLQADKVISI